jgi:hypothetical protein
MSVVTTAGAAIYQHYLDRGKDRYTTLGATREERATASTETTVVQAASAAASADQNASAVTRADHDALAVTRADHDASAATRADHDASAVTAAAQEERSRGHRKHWYAVAAAAVTIFAVVMGGITLIESATNKPISAALGGPERSGTSLGQAFGEGDSTRTEQPATPSTSPSASPSGSVKPTTPAPGQTKPPATTTPTKPPATTTPTTRPQEPPPPPPTTFAPAPGATP